MEGRDLLYSANCATMRDMAKSVKRKRARKHPTSFRLSSTAMLLLESTSTDLSISRASVVEMAIRDFAQSRRNGNKRTS